MPGSADHTRGIPHLRQTHGSTQLIVDGRPFIILGGEVHNSSASSLAYMEPVWERIARLNCNAALVPVYWELLEPAEGRYDFNLVDGLLARAREHGLRLVLLWFGTWKNALSSYTPAWVKTDPRRFPRAEIAPGRAGHAVSSLSAEARLADARAFGALMRHLREMDGEEHTVVAVQVENEAGLLGASRDRSPAAEEAFAGHVPQELLSYLAAHEDELAEELKAAREDAGRGTGGSWRQVFGPAADEAFMAWHVARYIDAVAAAGKAEYPLPMYVNAWLVQYPGEPPGSYPSGGPVSRMFDVWRCAAPHIDFFAPDIYLDDFAGVCASYTRAGNPLFIPEARRDASAAANVFYALGRHGALCFSPFGIEDLACGQDLSDGGAGEMLAGSYRLLAGMLPLIAAHQGTGRMTGLLRGEAEARLVELGGYRLLVRFGALGRDSAAPGGGLVISPADGRYIIAGHGFEVEFLPPGGSDAGLDFLRVEEGTYLEGRWSPGRRLNGDEGAAWEGRCRVRLGKEPGALEVELYTF
ncbi:MAG: DUF5597 domain-containing protein [Patescibacteria group bacterium]